MKKYFVVLTLAVMVLSGLCVLDIDCAMSAVVQTIEVSNAREFLEALGSDRIIEMDYTGDYNLSQLNRNAISLAKGVSWSDVFDGAELVLNGIKNLTIRGGGPEGTRAEIIIDPRYAFVMTFENCSDIVLEEIRAGHSKAGECEGGVFRFTDSSRITINWTSMYGCGTEGLVLSNTSGVKVTDSSIVDCTYYIMTVTGGRNIAFEDCMFMDNKEYTLVNVSGTRDMSFKSCYFNDNQGKMFEIEGTTISVTDSSFNRNKNTPAIQDSVNVKFVNCEFN